MRRPQFLTIRRSEQVQRNLQHCFGRCLSCHGRSQPCSVHSFWHTDPVHGTKARSPSVSGRKMRSLVTFSDIERGFACLLRVKLQAPAVWCALQILDYASDFMLRKTTPQAKRVTCFTRVHELASNSFVAISNDAGEKLMKLGLQTQLVTALCKHSKHTGFEHARQVPLLADLARETRAHGLEALASEQQSLTAPAVSYFLFLLSAKKETRTNKSTQRWRPRASRRFVSVRHRTSWCPVVPLGERRLILLASSR